MSKELIRPEQFAAIKTKMVDDANLQVNPELEKEIFDLYEDTLNEYLPGKIVHGTIIAIDSDGITVDIDYKSRGIVPKYEFSEHELKTFKAGQEIDVMIDTLENLDGTVVLSYEKAKAMRAWDEIVKLADEGKPVEGMVTHKVKGGLSVDIGIPAFLPGSQIDLQRVTNFDQYVGQTITAMILKVNKKRGNVIISRRKYLSEQRSESRKKILDTLSEGQVIQGTVKNITNYGVFIDIGGVDGLLHITDMTWGRIAHPSELVRIGEKISVKVLSFDKDNEKISLGLKQLSNNPWEQVSEQLKVGNTIKGKISSITDYGLFVEIAKGVEGLVHISEVSWTDRIDNLSKLYKVGQEIDVYVVSVDQENRRMSLSIKQLDKNPWEKVDQEFKDGQKIQGKISNITDFGIFVQLLPGIDGLVHISDLSWTEHIEHPSDRYKIGQEVEAVVLGIDKDNKKISLGIKQLSNDPWEKVDTEYPINSIVEGEISKISNFGAFVKLPLGVEGLVHNTTLAEQHGKKAEEMFKIGDKHQFRVVNVNKAERRLGLTTQLDATAAEAPAKEAHAPQEEKAKAAPRRQSKARQEAPASSTTSGTRGKSAFQMALENAMNDAGNNADSDKDDNK